MSDEKHVSVSSRAGVSAPGNTVAGTNLALVDSSAALDEFGPFELPASRAEARAARDAAFGDGDRDGDLGAEPAGTQRTRNRSSRKGSSTRPTLPRTIAQHTLSQRAIPNSQSSASGNTTSVPPETSPHSEEYYLSAALAEEGSRPSLAFVFPPLARAIEEAAREAQAPGTRSRKPFGRAHLHVVEGRSADGVDGNGLERLRDPFEIEPPDRNYDCRNYDTCLGLAAALNWNSFTCTGCSGSVNQHLLWRAHSEVRKNRTLAELCDLPDITASEQAVPEQNVPEQARSEDADSDDPEQNYPEETYREDT